MGGFGFGDRVLFQVSLALARLPPSLRLKLEGEPIVYGDRRMHPEVALFMRFGKRMGSMLYAKDRTPKRVRANLNRDARVGGGPPDGGLVADRTIEANGATIAVRHYPTQEDGAPLLVYLHGGGWVFGDLDTHDAPCRILRDHARAHVLAVDYRLAPEHPFPTALDDARAAFEWAHAHAAELGADPVRVGIGGDSVGGNLAAVIARLSAWDDRPKPAFQVLIYPTICRRTAWPSFDALDGLIVSRDLLSWFYDTYAGGAYLDAPPDERLEPLHGDIPRGLPPALVVTAGFDPLCDEGEAYAQKLEQAGTSVTLRRFDELIHGFVNMVGISAVCREAVVAVATDLRRISERQGA